jgi:hypothetical protein
VETHAGVVADFVKDQDASKSTIKDLDTQVDVLKAERAKKSQDSAIMRQAVTQAQEERDHAIRMSEESKNEMLKFRSELAASQESEKHTKNDLNKFKGLLLARAEEVCTLLSPFMLRLITLVIGPERETEERRTPRANRGTEGSNLRTR